MRIGFDCAPYISPPDDNFITFQRAMKLFAQDNPERNEECITEMLKQALFCREFNYRVAPIPGIDLGDDRNCPLLLMEAYRQPNDLAHDLAREERPQEYLSVVAETVAEVLGSAKFSLDHKKIGRHLQDFCPASALSIIL